MGKICSSYSQAIFELAKEKNIEDVVYEALHLVLSEFEDNLEYLEILSLSSLPIKKRFEMLDNVLLGVLPEDVLAFIKILLKNGRLRSLKEIISEFDDLYNESSHIFKAYIISAVPLLEYQKVMLVKNFEAINNCRVIPFFEVDKSLIGGVVVYINDKVFDGSVKYKLDAVRKVIRE